MAKLNPKIKKLITTVKECAKDVYQQLGPGWNEGIYQKAMEVALRERKVAYETQRILPIIVRKVHLGGVLGRTPRENDERLESVLG